MEYLQKRRQMAQQQIAWFRASIERLDSTLNALSNERSHTSRDMRARMSELSEIERQIEIQGGEL